MNIPDYIDCENNTKFCDWYMNLDCPESCDYVRLILEGGLKPEDLGLMSKLNHRDEDLEIE